ncbi:MAG: RNA polymerase subunit sigma-70, partial [Pisciglobus halotolerans]|nr:RNA polymerase subunit sigma-70 [Pisciglobus halotolerans]
MSNKKDNFYENLTDLEIISIIQGGDYHPFELLFLRYEPLVKKMVQTYYLQGYEKDDFYQESRMVFDKVIKTYDSERGLTFGSFYKVTLRHHFFSLIRKDMAKKRKADKFADSLEMLAEAGKLPNSMFIKSDYTYQEALEVKENIPSYF